MLEAENSAITALEDKDCERQTAAAAALGSDAAEHTPRSRWKNGLERIPEPRVVLAAANLCVLLM